MSCLTLTLGARITSWMNSILTVRLHLLSNKPWSLPSPSQDTQHHPHQILLPSLFLPPPPQSHPPPPQSHAIPPISNLLPTIKHDVCLNHKTILCSLFHYLLGTVVE